MTRQLEAYLPVRLGLLEVYVISSAYTVETEISNLHIGIK